MKTNKFILLIIGLLAISWAQADSFNKARSSNERSDYSNHATGPTISVEGRQYQFLPQARSELSSRSVSTSRLPGLTDDDGTPAFAPTSSQGSGQYLASKGRYDVYLEDQSSFLTLAAKEASDGADCGFCQVLYDSASGELALLTADISVRLAENSREAAEQLAQDYGLSLKYYMGRIGLAVFSAPSLSSALDVQLLMAQDDGVRRARHSIVSQTYQPQ